MKRKHSILSWFGMLWAPKFIEIIRCPLVLDLYFILSRCCCTGWSSFRARRSTYWSWHPSDPNRRRVWEGRTDCDGGTRPNQRVFHGWRKQSWVVDRNRYDHARFEDCEQMSPTAGRDCGGRGARGCGLGTPRCRLRVDQNANKGGRGTEWHHVDQRWDLVISVPI